ncbi:AAA family ATPase [Microcoleus sp. Pol17_C1]|uniref:AAA family ATPase n=1 Tax=unclassified Microcoleus TaxID=2642155 RepID=UPI002FD2A8E9
MIRAIRCNHTSFKTVEFRPGFNVILADRTEESGSKDSRNGLGKSTLIEIIHFCLGSTLQKAKGLDSINLRGWAFSLELTLSNQVITVWGGDDPPQTHS